MIIRDSIHKDIIIEEKIIEDLIRTKEFQRLRRIKQLGLSNLIYPSAEHNRYSHSIGVFHLARTFSEILENKMSFKFDFKEKRAFHIAALLHDLGHGPFSHAAEHFFNYDHEEFTIKIIESPETDINKILTENDYIDDVVKFIGKTHQNKVLVSLLSSAVDVDRMDYLNRDAYNCGVAYGQFDLDRMKKIIDIDWENQRIVFDENSIHTIEDFLMSRYHMFTQVYLNDKSIGYESLVGEILLHIHKLIDDKHEFKAKSVYELAKFYCKEIKVQDFIEMDDFKLYYILEDLYNNETDKKLIDLIDVLLSYKELTITFDKEESKGYEYRWRSDAYSKSIYSKRKPIYIKMKSGEIKKLDEVSSLVDFMDAKLRINMKPMYFCINYEEKN